MSKFKHILAAAKQRESETPQTKITPDNLPTPKKRGRPKGKRSDPDYEQVTAYIKKDTYRQIRIALISSPDSQDFSELVEQLLADFLRTQNFKSPRT